jgi:hypothetical protein
MSYKLFDFDIPEEFGGGDPSREILAYGPFVIMRQQQPDLGINLERNGDDVLYWNGGRGVKIDPTFRTNLVSNGYMTAISPQYAAQWVFRPILESDRQWIEPMLGDQEIPDDFDAFIDTIRETLDGG